MKPLDLLLPLALSNFLPLDWTFGALPLCGPKPKCLTASLEFLGPLKIKVFLPVGALKANSSKVIASPPFFKMVALAPLVNFKAATVAFGKACILTSSVTVPTTTTVFLEDSAGFKALAILETETGGLLILDKNKDFKTTLLKEASVLPVENKKEKTKSMSELVFLALKDSTADSEIIPSQPYHLPLILLYNRTSIKSNTHLQNTDDDQITVPVVHL